MLRVYIHEVRTELLERSQLHGHIAHKGAALTRGSYDAAYGNLGLIVEVELLEEVLKVEPCDVERGLHHAVALEVLRSLTLVLGAKQQTQRTEEDGLTRTCLTSDDVEVLVPLYMERVDKGVVLYR